MISAEHLRKSQGNVQALIAEAASKTDVPSHLWQDFEEQQGLVARLIHQLRSDDTDETFSVLRAAADKLQQSGPRRLSHTLPPLAFCAIQLVPHIKKREDTGEKPEASCKTVSVPIPDYLAKEYATFYRSHEDN